MSVKFLRMVAIALPIAFATAETALADELVGEYSAYISDDDLTNSNGERLLEPWQIIRQDRANYYKFGIRQDGDEPDPFFSSASNRAKAERMIRNGSMTREARRLLLQGDCMINVEIYRSVQGDYLMITVN
jgi:hypothetical protein